MIYLDSCALLKLVREEDESAVLQDWLAERSGEGVVTSELSRAEMARVVRRNNHTEQGVLIDAAALHRELAAAAAVLDALSQLVVDRDVLDRAGSLDAPMIRTLDAIHLASAAELGPADIELVTYDRRLAAAATAAGLTVVAPG